MRFWNLTLALCLTVPLGCGSDHGAAPDEAGDDAGRPEPYVICDGSDDVRLSLRAVSGDEINTTDKYTLPYGDGFAFVNGKCAYLAGGSRMGLIVQGTLTEAQASELADRLGLASLDWPPNGECDQLHAGGFQIQTVDAIASCWCTCGEGPQQQLSDVLTAAYDATRAMISAGKVLDGPVEVGGMSIPMYSVDYVAWPLASDLGPLTIPKAEFQKTRELPFAPFVGQEAASLRALRTAEGQDLWNGTYVAHRGGFYELYILDVLPEPFASGILAFELTPRP